jgi:anti-sigma regulatory factor (Ser/Thr protein kinase)
MLGKALVRATGTSSPILEHVAEELRSTSTLWRVWVVDQPEQEMPLEVLLSLPLEMQRLAGLRDEVRAYLASCAVPQAIIEDVLLCVHEACTNALLYGHSAQPIEVGVTVSGSLVSATVRGGGAGFDPHLADVADPPDPMRAQGRGLFIISFLMDSLELDCARGTTLYMSKDWAA